MGSGSHIGVWGATRAAPRRFEAADFPAPAGPRLRALLARQHADRPFSPRDVRDAARRVVEAAERLTLDAVVIRGGLDIGGAELDHVWTLVDGRVVDVSLPVVSPAFLAVLRAYVAGDLTDGELDRAAHGYPLEWRVIGDFPGTVRYVGLPVLADRRG